MSFTVTIPVPPSLNNAYVTRKVGGGKLIRVLSAETRSYKIATATLINALIRPERAIVGAYDVVLELPAKMRGDADNRLKIAIDSLVMSGRVTDDQNMRGCTARKCLDDTAMARITVTPARSYALAGGAEP